jgi:hypothetical protein
MILQVEAGKCHYRYYQSGNNLQCHAYGLVFYHLRQKIDYQSHQYRGIYGMTAGGAVFQSVFQRSRPVNQEFQNIADNDADIWYANDNK